MLTSRCSITSALRAYVGQFLSRGFVVLLRKSIPQNHNLKTAAELGVKLECVLKIIFKQKDFIEFCVKSTLIASIPAVALAFSAHFILRSIFPGAEWLYPTHTETNVYIDILGAVILSPLIETYILI